MTRRAPKLFILPAMRRERADGAERHARADEITEGCRRAIRRGMSVYAGAERDCPMRVCRRARACVSDSFACLGRLRRPVLPALDEHIAVDGLRQFVVEQARAKAKKRKRAW